MMQIQLVEFQKHTYRLPTSGIRHKNQQKHVLIEGVYTDLALVKFGVKLRKWT